jgi:uncharacterized protein
MLQGIVTADPATVKLDLVPINPEWILEGAPRARADGLASSQDDAICTMVWDGGAGRFRWLYADDEIVHITSGDVAIIDERTLSPGDMGLFPAGPTSTWHVPVNVRELAALHHAMVVAFVGGVERGAHFHANTLRRLRIGQA